MEKKKAYDPPEAEKLALEDEDLERVSGGAGEEYDGGTEDDPGRAGNGDVGEGRGRGGSCDGVPFQRDARTFSSGRNSNC